MYKLKGLGLLLMTLLCLTSNKVSASVTAAFTVTKADLCQDSAFRFFDATTTSGETISTYAWTFGDGVGTSTSANPNYTYTAPGTYTVSLTVTGSGGSKSTATKKVVVHGNGSLDFSMTGALCARSEITLEALYKASDSFTSFVFSYSNGGSTKNSKTSKVFTSAGTYTITLTATTKYGCEKSVSKTITILPRPLARITFVSRCEDSLINLSAATSELNGTTITKYRWVLPGNVIVDSMNVKRYLNPGLQPVQLFLYTSNGCGDSLTQLITVYSKPNINVTATTTCADSLTYFYDRTTGGAEWSWNFGFSGPGSTLTYSARRDTVAFGNFPGPGTYNVKLTVKSNKGCVSTSTFPVIVNPLPKPSFDVYNRCEDTTVQFTDLTAGTVAKRLWKFSDSTTSTLANPKKVFKHPGEAWAQLFITNQYGCLDSLQKTFTVFPRPKATLISTEGCQDSLMTFVSTSTVKALKNRPDSISAVYWMFGDGGTGTGQTVTHRYVNPGTYTLKMVATSAYGCTDTLTRSIIVNDKATPAFTFGNSCERDSISFTSTSTVKTGYTIAETRWFWGDGSNSDTGRTAQHLYQQPGTYKVTMQVTTNKACISTLTKDVVVLPSPRVDYAFNLACFGREVNFTNKTVYAGSGGVTQSYVWDFGDSSATSSDKNPTHTFKRAGTFNVKLTETSTDGCRKSIIYPVQVYPVPAPNFTFANNCSDSLFYFNSTSTIPTGSIVKYSWTFSDGTTAAGARAIKKFSAPGQYTATLYATSDQGCVDSISKTVTVFEKPVAAFTYVQTCADSNVFFTNTSYIAGNDSVTAWRWEFNNGIDVYSSKDVSYKFPSEGGDFAVRLISYSSRGCADTLDQIVRVNSQPQPNFTAPARCAKNVYNFFDITPPVLVGHVVEWEWDFGDGGTAIGKNVQHVFQDSGFYPVTLTVKTDKGCETKMTRNVEVYPIPQVKFWYSGACLGEDFNFVDSTTVPGGIINRMWEFGDASGSRSSQPNPSFNYADTPGLYRVRLSITAANGQCIGVKDSLIRVYGPPRPKFATSAVCRGNVTHFFDRSEVDFATIVEYRYDFGDGQRAVYAPGAPVSHIYDVEGNYNVRLTVVTNVGCAASYDTIVTVFPLPKAILKAEPEFLTVNDSVITFINQSKGNAQTFWDFGDGETTLNNAPTVQHTYGDTGVYHIVMAVANEFGCTDTTRFTLNVLEVYSMFAPNSFSPNGDDVNDYWYPKGAGFARYHVVVVNRWGQKVFESKDPNARWDGKIMGTDTDAPVGEYRYVVNSTDYYETEFKKMAGYILLIR